MIAVIIRGVAKPLPGRPGANAKRAKKLLPLREVRLCAQSSTVSRTSQSGSATHSLTHSSQVSNCPRAVMRSTTVTLLSCFRENVSEITDPLDRDGYRLCGYRLMCLSFAEMRPSFPLLQRIQAHYISPPIRPLSCRRRCAKRRGVRRRRASCLRFLSVIDFASLCGVSQTRGEGGGGGGGGGASEGGDYIAFAKFNVPR